MHDCLTEFEVHIHCMAGIGCFRVIMIKKVNKQTGKKNEKKKTQQKHARTLKVL